VPQKLYGSGPIQKPSWSFGMHLVVGDFNLKAGTYPISAPMASDWKEAALKGCHRCWMT
jgi:hypothetical protein